MNKPLAIVIGMGPGLGQALVRTFANDGFAVAFVGRRPEAVAGYETRLRAQNLDVSGFAGDAAQPDVMDGVFRQIRARYGDADALIYNAAMIEPARFVTQSGLANAQYGSAAGWAARGAPASFDYVVDAFKTNVAGAHHAAANAAPGMMEKGRGTILFTGGVLAFEPWIEWGVTAMGKAGLRSLGHSLHKELIGHGVHVSTVAIHGTMQAGTAYDHELVAASYLGLHYRPSSEWVPDFHFKAEHEEGGDPDA